MHKEVWMNITLITCGLLTVDRGPWTVDCGLWTVYT
jgi:hypothetical protein